MTLATLVTTADVLRAALAKIDSPERWTQMSEARNANGEYVPPRDSRACKFCPFGALLCVLDMRVEYLWLKGDAIDQRFRDSVTALTCLIRSDEIARRPDLPQQLPDDDIVLTDWNDEPDRTHEQVVDLFKRAIAAEESHR